MTCLWTSHEITALVNGRCQTDFSITGLSIDSREVVKGDLFIALNAERDGHDYVATALENGAAGALVNYLPKDVNPDNKSLIITSQNTLAALNVLGITARQRTQAKVVAITGSVGKTGTKEQLRTIFKAIDKNTHAAVRSFNNHIGVPLTLARMPASTTYSVFEIGMNHPGEIAPLAKLCTPDVAMITTIAPVHLAAFDDVAGIAREKASIFRGLKSNGIAIIPRDTHYYQIVADTARACGVLDANTLTFGIHPAADARLLKCTSKGNQTIAHAHIRGYGDLEYTINANGQHLALNALGALLCAQVCGVDLTTAATALSEWFPPTGRGDKWQINVSTREQFTLIDDSYNANPASLAASLDVLAQTAKSANGGKRIAILTDMLELGEHEETLHKEIATQSSIAHIDTFYLAGTRMKYLFDALPKDKQGLYAPDAATLVTLMHECSYNRDIVLVKGSNGSNAGHITHYLKSLGTTTPLSVCVTDILKT